MAVEVGSAYISLRASDKELTKSIKAGLDASVKDADAAGQKMGQKLASQLGTHMQKGGSQSGDAFSRAFTPKVQGAGKNAMQGLAQAMLGGAEGIGSQVGGGISGGLLSALSRGADNAIGALARIGESRGWSSGLVTAGTVAAGGVALIGTAAFAAGQQLYKIGEMWDGVADGITFKTGLVGEKLDAVKNSIKNVARDTAADIGDIANVSAALVKGLKIPPGEGLEKLTQQISEYNAAAQENGAEPLNLREFIKAMKQMKIDGDVDAMMKQFDELYKVTENTTIPMNDLIRNLKTLGPVAETLKIPATNLVQIIAAMEDSGLNAETAMLALRTAWKNLGDVPDPAGGLRAKIAEIRTLLQSTSEQSRIAGEKMATEFFGNRAGPALAQAIREGNVELDNFDTNASRAGLTVKEMTKNTEDFSQEWKKFKSFLSTDLEPTATKVFGGINAFLVETMRQTREKIEWLKQLAATVGIGGSGPAQNGVLPNAPGMVNGTTPTVGGIPIPGLGAGLPSGVGGGGRGWMNYGKTSSYLDQTAGPVERWRPAVKAALAAYGPQYGITNTAAWESAMMRQIATESGGNPTVWNNWDSNAAAGTPSRGLLQFIPGTFNAYNITGGDIMDPAAQIAAFIPYVMRRYGVDANGAPLQVGRGVGYDTGGWLPPGATWVINKTGKPELVLNPEQQQALADQGVDPNTLLHGAANGAAPGPDVNTADVPAQKPDFMANLGRTQGFTPTTGSAKAGTSTLASFIGMGGEFVGGLIDTGASLLESAASAAAAASGAAGGPAGSMGASAAASYGIKLGAAELKRVVNWGFQLGGIGADALISQLFPLGGGAPRWIGYDYTGMMPQMGVQQAALTTIEQMGKQAIQDTFGPQQPRPGVPTSAAAMGPQELQPQTAQPVVKIDNIYGMDPASVATEITSQQKLAAMRFTGRPY